MEIFCSSNKIWLIKQQGILANFSQAWSQMVQTDDIKKEHDPFDMRIKNKSSLASFSIEFLNNTAIRRLTIKHFRR